MNVIRSRQQERITRINILAQSIANAENPDFNKLWIACATEWGITKRYFNEILEVAKIKAVEIAGFKMEQDNKIKKEVEDVFNANNNTI
jgi:hypothetical protein